MKLSTIDIAVFIAYCLIVLSVGLFVSLSSKNKDNANGYFLAGRGLTWWIVGASIIASNISAEQFVGMSGSGYAVGMAIATYEWIAALGLVIVAKYFIPIFLKMKIYTMPQFLENRFDKRVKTVMAFFWLLVFVFINLTSILYLGAITIEQLVGTPLLYSIIGLAVFAAIYSIYGGLKAVAVTDVIQVVFLILGGLVTVYFCIDMLGMGEGFLAGVKNFFNSTQDKCHLILDKSNPAYADLPGLSVILGGLWVANLYYWGCNQYIIQRSLAAKSTNEAQKGMLFAGYIKILIPILVVMPGMAAYALNAPVSKPDETYPWLLANIIPVGIRGLAFAALTAAIVSSLASMLNSISTIFSIDIYKEYIKKDCSEKGLVTTGRVTAFVSLVIAVCIAPLLADLDQAFQYIQEFTGFISPGALAIFLAGFFYKKANAKGALIAAIGTFVLSVAMKFALPELPWMDRMGIVFLSCCLLIFLFRSKTPSEKAITITNDLFRTSKSFNILSLVLLAILVGIYLVWW